MGGRGRSLCPEEVQSPTSLPPQTLSKLLREEGNNPSVVWARALEPHRWEGTWKKVHP